VTDERILREIEAILQRVKNDTLPDVDRLFGRELRFDMAGTDVSERVLRYFMLCNKLIEEHGLVACFDGEHGAKEKCKLLIESLSPGELKLEVKNAIRFQVPAARSDECKLHNLVLEKALEQDRDFRRRKRARYDEQFDKPDKPAKLQNRKRPVDQSGRDQRGSTEKKRDRSDEADRVVRSDAQPAADRIRPAAPKDGCLKCGGPHYVAKSPNATEEEKKGLPKKFHAKRPDRGRMKRIKERLGAVHTIRLNDSLELRYCADTGSDWCLISRNNFDKLVQLGSDVSALALEKPVLGKAVGGHEVEARESVRL
jgi:hypothetical protein